MERLDKILSNMGHGSRKEVKEYIKKGRVTVDGVIVKDEAKKTDPVKSVITLDGMKIEYRKHIYLIMNKPAGVISATEDDYDETVIDLLNSEDRIFSPFPVGRLDKDTVGLLLLTDSGELNHRLISPKWNIKKTYRAFLENNPEENYGEKIREGIILDDGYKCLPGEFETGSDSQNNEVFLTIQEGKFHQVKRMFESLGNKVTFLERISFGGIVLPEDLPRGEYRHLTDEEKSVLFELTDLTE